MSQHRTLHPENKLDTLVGRPGGMTRAAAIAEGARLAEQQRGPAMAGLRQSLDAIEAALPGLSGDQLSRMADRVVTLATYYDLHPLADAARRLCDLVALFEQSARSHPESLAVHVRAMRLFLPDPSQPSLNAAKTALVIAELEKISRRWGAPPRS